MRFWTTGRGRITSIGWRRNQRLGERLGVGLEVTYQIGRLVLSSHGLEC